MAAGLTWAAHSSVAVVLLVMSFAAKGAVPPDAAFALVLGANLGTAINPVLEGVSGDDPVARRLPIGNLLNRALGCVVALVLLNRHRPVAGADRARSGARRRRLPYRLQPDPGRAVPSRCWGRTPSCCGSCCRHGLTLTTRRGRAIWTRRRWRSPPIALGGGRARGASHGRRAGGDADPGGRGAGEHRSSPARRGATAGRRARSAEHRDQGLPDRAGPRGPVRGRSPAPVASACLRHQPGGGRRRGGPRRDGTTGQASEAGRAVG